MGLLHLVRHGETTGNVGKVLDTRPPGAPLTPRGVEQARQFAENHPIASVDSPVLLCSIARRAQQTAESIGAVWNQPYTVIDDIYEIQAGDLEGRSDDAAVDIFKDVVKRWHTGEPTASLPGGESATDLLERYLPVIADVRERYLRSSDVYIVSHGAAIRLVAAALAAVDGTFAHQHHLPNTGEIVLRPIATGWQLVSWADAPSPVDPMG